jgi:hypothetical protein
LDTKCTRTRSPVITLSEMTTLPPTPANAVVGNVGFGFCCLLLVVVVGGESFLLTFD